MKSISGFILILVLSSACNYSGNTNSLNSAKPTVVLDNSSPDLGAAEDQNLEQETDVKPVKVFLSITPSTEWIDSMQALNGEDGWSEVIADNEYYIDLAKSYLLSKGYRELEEPTEKIWKLKGENGKVRRGDSDTLKDKWGLIIFDGQNEPVFYNGTQPELDLKGM